MLAVHLEECRMLYNHFVEDRIQAYKDRGTSLGRYDQINHDETLSQATERVASVIKKSYAGRSCSDEQNRGGVVSCQSTRLRTNSRSWA